MKSAETEFDLEFQSRSNRIYELGESDIQSEIQHHLGKTRRIDMSKCPYIALFFACYSGGNHDGRIMFFNKDELKSHGELRYPEYIDNTRFKNQKSVLFIPNDGYIKPSDKNVLKFKELLILDVAHQRAKTGYKVLPKGAEGFFVGSTSDFEDNRIQERCSEATLRIDEQNIDEARTLVQEFLKNHRFIDLLPGHFAFSIIRRWITHTVNVRQRILEEDIRIYLSTEVWRLVKTRDHNSLKRRLRRAVREAEKIRQANKS